MSRIIFVTGTDTGVGKTLLTALLLSHLRVQRVKALAMKPFCSGDRGDVDLIQVVQGYELPQALVNPFYFPEPLAPLIASRQRGQRIQPKAALKSVLKTSQQCDTLLVEGSGGILVPLAEGFTVADFIRELGCEVIVVSRNKLGTINHTCLTVLRLLDEGVKELKVVLMQEEVGDASAEGNRAILREMLFGIEVIGFPFLGENANENGAIKESAKKTKKTLATILKAASFCVRSSKGSAKAKTAKRLKTKKVR